MIGCGSTKTKISEIALMTFVTMKTVKTSRQLPVVINGSHALLIGRQMKINTKVAIK